MQGTSETAEAYSFPIEFSSVDGPFLRGLIPRREKMSNRGAYPADDNMVAQDSKQRRKDPTG